MNPISTIAVSFFFARWGDRLWNFAVGLYLIKLTPGSMQLAAIYGLVQTSASILFLPVIGDWIDRTNRLRAVRTLLVLTNVLILMCAVCILLHLYVVIESVHWLAFLRTVIIILGASAKLAGDGEKISVQRDWVVVVCRNDNHGLAKANAVLRRIDLMTAIQAPVAVGLLMTVVSDLAGVVFISTWCVITMFAEYFLMRYVYVMDPGLQGVKGEKESLIEKKTAEVRYSDDRNNTPKHENSAEVDKMKVNLFIKDSSQEEIVFDHNEKGEKCVVTVKNVPLPTSEPTSAMSKLNFMQRLKTTITGWKVYRQQPTMFAGLSLSALYFTSLGFNAITNSFAYSQGLEEIYVSICYGLGSLSGIAGTFIFPIVRKKIGLIKAGFVGQIMQASMLVMCVVSIWLPGSPASFTLGSNFGSRTSRSALTSIVVFMIGIILSRAGLWITDLTITQIQQERVPEEERGTVGGVQNACNSIFNLAHYFITICLPYPSQFWLLILMSVMAVVCSFLTYVLFNYRFAKIDYERLE